MILATAIASFLVGFNSPEALEINADCTLDPSRVYGSIVIKASKITIDGRGATVQGMMAGHPKTFKGVGILAQDVSQVTLRNIKVKGFETGLHLRRATGWTIENCDFSDNFHDPDFGWGENGRRGGILLEDCRMLTLRNNRANRVWDACSLVNCEGLTITDNDFSHTSNTCLKLWRSSRNTIAKNNLSYGLRIKTDEVHARDSTGVLIESGSDDNQFQENDVTHGGDGIFIRVLNGWVSRRNVFTRNDVSYANNNGFEAWSPENTYLDNKANHCSYGFWLGASDKTVLEGNEASFNGLSSGFHNSPHLPEKSHAGIVFMFGPSSHTTVRNNRCQGNQGAGIALIGEAGKFKAYHWIIEGNTLRENRWGIYAREADWVTLGGNRFEKNSEADFSRDPTVTNIIETTPQDTSARVRLPKARLLGPKVVVVNQQVSYQAEPSGSQRDLANRISLGDGRVVRRGKIEPSFPKPGFQRLGLTTSGASGSSLAWIDVYVLDSLKEQQVSAKNWTWADPASRVSFADDRSVSLVGPDSTQATVQPYGGGRVNLLLKLPEPVPLARVSSLVFWIKFQNENIPGWQGPNPVVELQGHQATLKLTPDIDRLAQPSEIEAREGWTRFEVPIATAPGWKRSGVAPQQIETLGLGLDSWGSDPLTVWIDGISFREAK